MYLQPDPLAVDPEENVADFWMSGNLVYGYAANRPLECVDTTGQGVVDCVAEVAKLARLMWQLQKRIAESGGCPDAGHQKAIDQLDKAVQKQWEKVARHCGDPTTLLELLAIGILVSGVAATTVGGAVGAPAAAF